MCLTLSRQAGNRAKSIYIGVVDNARQNITILELKMLSMEKSTKKKIEKHKSGLSHNQLPQTEVDVFLGPSHLAFPYMRSG